MLRLCLLKIWLFVFFSFCCGIFLLQNDGYSEHALIVVVYPTNNTIVNSHNPIFVWSNVLHGNIYYYQDFSTKDKIRLFKDPGSHDPSYTKLYTNTLLDAANYSFAAGTTNKWSLTSQGGDASVGLTFIIPLLTPPSLLLPSNGSIVNTDRPTLVWTAEEPSDVLGYEIWLWSTNAESTNILTVYGSNATSVVVSTALTNFTEYYWKVRALVMSNNNNNNNKIVEDNLHFTNLYDPFSVDTFSFIFSPKVPSGTVATSSSLFSNELQYGVASVDNNFILTNFGSLGITYTNKVIYDEKASGWWTVSNPTGFLAPNSSVIITSIVDSASILPGNYFATNKIDFDATDESLYVVANLTITQAVLIAQADNTSRVYGADNPEFTITYIGFVNGDDDVSALSQRPTVSSVATKNSSAGIYDILVSDGTASNYKIISSNGVLTITQALLAVQADDTDKMYGTPNPVFMVKYKGFLNSDDTNVLTQIPTVSCTAGVRSAVGKYPIIVNTNGSATNYVFSYSDGTLTIKGGATVQLTMASLQARGWNSHPQSGITNVVAGEWIPISAIAKKRGRYKFYKWLVDSNTVEIQDIASENTFIKLDTKATVDAVLNRRKGKLPDFILI